MSGLSLPVQALQAPTIYSNDIFQSVAIKLYGFLTSERGS